MMQCPFGSAGLGADGELRWPQDTCLFSKVVWQVRTRTAAGTRLDLVIKSVKSGQRQLYYPLLKSRYCDSTSSVLSQCYRSYGCIYLLRDSLVDASQWSLRHFAMQGVAIDSTMDHRVACQHSRRYTLALVSYLQQSRILN